MRGSQSHSIRRTSRGVTTVDVVKKSQVRIIDHDRVKAREYDRHSTRRISRGVATVGLVGRKPLSVVRFVVVGVVGSHRSTSMATGRGGKYIHVN